MRLLRGQLGLLVLLVTPAASMAEEWPCGSLYTPFRSGDIFINAHRREPQFRPSALVNRTLFTLGWCPIEVYETFSWDPREVSRWIQYFHDYSGALINDPQSAEVRQFLVELAERLVGQQVEPEYDEARATILEALQENPLTQSDTLPQVDPLEKREPPAQVPCGVVARRVIEEAIQSWESSPAGPERAQYSDDLLFPLGSCPDSFYSAMAYHPAVLATWLQELPESSFVGDPVKGFESSRVTLILALLRHTTSSEHREIETTIIRRLQEFEAKPYYVPRPNMTLMENREIHDR